MTDRIIPWMNRRNAIMTAAATAAVTTSVFSSRAEAEEFKRTTMAFRGRDGQYVRPHLLDLESKGNFCAGLVMWHQGELEEEAAKRANELLKAAGIDPKADLPLQQVVALLGNDPVIIMTGRARLTGQRLKWRLLQTELHKIA